MPLLDLDDEDRKVVWECLRSAAHGPFYPDWDFETLFGAELQEIQSIFDRWPTIDDSDEEVYAAISNSMNNLLIYPIDNPERWGEFLSVGPDEIARVFAVWRGSRPSSPIDGMR